MIIILENYHTAVIYLYEEFDLNTKSTHFGKSCNFT